MLQVEVLEAQAASGEEAGNEIGCAVQVGEDAQAEVGLDVGGLLGAEGMQVAERDAEGFLVEEEEGGKGLVWGRGGDWLDGSEMGEEGFDLRRAHGVAGFVS